MQHRTQRSMLIWSLLWIGLASAAEHGKFNAVLKPGVTAPALPGLVDLEGRPFTWHGVERAPAVVLIVTRNHCPISQKYAPRIRKLVEEFAPRGVSFIAINPDSRKGEDLKGMQAHARQQGWRYPYLKDGHQRVTKAFGGTVTPQFFLLGASERGGGRRVLYYGALDDDLREERVQVQYLKLGLQAVLEGKPLEYEETLAVGCEILRDPSQE